MNRNTSKTIARLDTHSLHPATTLYLDKNGSLSYQH